MKKKEVIKRIRGREYRYLQWYEDGKVKVKYIEPVERKVIKLSEEIKRDLIEAYDKAGYSCRKVKEYARERYGVKISERTVWKIMVGAGVIRKRGKSKLREEIEELKERVKELEEENKRKDIEYESFKKAICERLGLNL